MKTITFDGRIGASGAEVRMTKGGKPYVKFSVANNSFANGAEKTEWYDITSYDPYIIENRVKFLTKGTYVIISGTPNVEVNVDRNGKVWLNQYVTASTIDTPTFKKKDEDSTSATANNATVNNSLSTYTGSTLSSTTIPKPEIPKPEPAPAVATVGSAPVSSVNESAADAMSVEIDDDLPF